MDYPRFLGSSSPQSRPCIIDLEPLPPLRAELNLCDLPAMAVPVFATGVSVQSRESMPSRSVFFRYRIAEQGCSSWRTFPLMHAEENSLLMCTAYAQGRTLYT